MLSQYDSSESPTVSPMSLMVYPARDSSPTPEDSNAQYIYSETSSMFYGGGQWGDYSLTRMSNISPMLLYEDAYAQSPENRHSIWETPVPTNGPDLTYSESPISKPVLYGHQVLSRDNTPPYMTCSQLRNKDLDQDERTASHPRPSDIMIKDEPTEDSAAYLSKTSTSQSTSSSCDDADARCIGGISYRSHDNDEHDTYRTDSPLQFEASNPCSPGKGLRKGGNAPHAGKTADEIDVEDEEIPYAQLIYKALMSIPSRTMILGEIYQYFRENIPRFSKMRGKGWQNSIRHNLSMNGAFRKVERPLAPDGSKQRGYYWVLSREAEEEGVKSTTRFRKNSTSSRRKPSGAISDHKENIPLSHRRKKARSAAASKSSSRKSSRVGDSHTAKNSPSRTPSPAVESKTTVHASVHASVQVKGNDLLPDMQSHGVSILEDTPLPHDLDSSQNFDPTLHPALYTSMWDLQPATYYYADSYSSGSTSYDENINSIFNEEFALLRRSQALQPVISSGYSSPPQWPTQWPLR